VSGKKAGFPLPHINLDEHQVEPEVLKLVPAEVANRHVLFPIHRDGATLVVAMSDPSNVYALDELKFVTQFNVEPVIADRTAIRRAINRYYFPS
jgi:type IV pilus assembly protein PilB